MQARAVSRFNMLSARKARQVADLIRGKNVEEAVHILELTPKKAATIIQKTILAAVANARQEDEAAGIPDQDFVVSQILIDEGPTLKRIQPRAQGRAFRIRKRMSHVRVTVQAETEAEESGSKTAARSRE